jgi:hypothetical protein
MEDHLVAAYSALLIGHMLINQEKDKLIDIIEVKSKLKDGSFKFMTQIIRKFIVFMKIMVSFINFNSKLIILIQYIFRIQMGFQQMII